MLKPIDLTKPFDFSLVRAASEKVHIKGLFLADYVKELAALGEKWPKSYVAFKEYPANELTDLVERLVAVKHKHKPLRAALHDIALVQYPALRDSMIGKVIFGVLGNNVAAVMRAAGKGYAVASSELGPVTVIEADDRHAVLELTEQALPLEGWHSGVLSGAVIAMKRTVTQVSVDLKDEFNGQLEIRWA